MVDVKYTDLGLDKYIKQMTGLRGRGVKVGIQADAGAQDGVDLLDIAIYNEYGTEHIPARPFMGDFFDKNEKVIGTVMDRMADSVAHGDDIDRALGELGEFVEGGQKEHIQQSKHWAKPNDPSTIRQKGSDTPLIDEGLMLGAVRAQKL